MQLHDKYKDQGFEVIAMNMEGEEKLELAEMTLKRLKIAVTNFSLAEAMSDEGLAAAQAEGLLPEINLYDRQGRMRYHFAGAIDHEEVELRLAELLNE